MGINRAAANVRIAYKNSDTDFTIEFSRIDRNNQPVSSHGNGQLNDQISELEQLVLASLRKDPRLTNVELIEITGKSQRTITRVLAALKGKNLITRMGSNKVGYWKVK
jgi:ATP-dependent DNA helicase RecG